MKTRIRLIITTLLACQFILAETHIQVDDPLTWKAESLLPYVGQEVIFDVPMYVCSNDKGYTISTRRLFSPTNQSLPRSTDYNTTVSLNAAGRVNLNSVSGYHRCGEKIYNLRAYVSSINTLVFKTGEWRGNTQKDLLNMNVHKELGVEGCDSCLVVCAYNLEWYDITKTTKQQKINAALTLIDADILGLIEIEGQEATRRKVADLLNGTLTHRNYKAIIESKGLGESQTVVFLYDSKRVKPYGEIQYIDRRVANRKKMICFEHLATGERFIYSLNHFKAKTGGGAGGNADMHDGQGGWNADRKEEAQAVMDEYKTFSRLVKDKDILLMGDLNAYGKEDPITVLKNNGMNDLHRWFHADSSYSYQYGGLAGYLDHALCSNTMMPQVTGVMALHCNSDEIRNRSASDNTMFCGSDHDPVAVGLRLDSTKTYDPSPEINTYDVMTGQSGDIVIRNAANNNRAFYAIYTVSGLLVRQQDLNGEYVDKKEILSMEEHVTLPAASGMYILYIYANGQVYQRRFIVR